MACTVGSKSCPDEEEADASYHTDQFYRWHMDQLDPSIALVSAYNIGNFWVLEKIKKGCCFLTKSFLKALQQCDQKDKGT